MDREKTLSLIRSRDVVLVGCVGQAVFIFLEVVNIMKLKFLFIPF